MPSKDTFRNLDLQEAIADIAYLAGREKYYSGDSRGDISQFISWAQEFCYQHRKNNWDDGSYIETIHAFAMSKIDPTPTVSTISARIVEMRPKPKPRLKKKAFKLLIKYARREPTTAAYGSDKLRFDVAVYDDKACTKPYCRFMWYNENKPKPHYKTATMNCYKWQLLWLPDLKTKR